MIEKRAGGKSGLIKCEYIVGDIISQLQKFNDNTFDMMYADPPYKVGKDIMGDEKDQSFRLFICWTTEWLYEAIRTLKIGCHAYISFAQIYAPYLYLLIQEPDFFLKHWNSTFDEHKVMYLHYWMRFRNWRIIHFKDVQKPYPFGIANYNYDYEPVLFYSKGLKNHKVKPLNKIRTKTGYQCVLDVKTPQHKRHPTQKPNELYWDILLHSTNVGDTVLDCFTGSGNLLLTSRRLKRNSIGIDGDPKYLTKWKDVYEQLPIIEEVINPQRRLI